MSRFIGLLAATLLLFAPGVRAQIMFHQELFVGGNGCKFSSIQAAIDAANPQDYIYIVSSNYSGHLSIDKSLSLIGTDACGNNHPPARPQPFASIDGSGGSDAPVLNITGISDVYVSGLEFTGGHAGAGTGGGINFHGNGGSLHLSNVALIRNSATDGGGLAIAPIGSSVPDVYLGDDVQMLLNTASDAGGGLYVGGHSEAFVTGKGDFIALNTATNRGGGIFVQGPAHLALGSPGLNGALVADNTAQYGGGIAADTGDQDVAEEQIVSLFTTDALFPGEIADNHATVEGGGVYIKSRSGANGVAGAFCAMDFRIDDNWSPQGAALFLDSDHSIQNGTTGARAYLNAVPCRSSSELGAVRCAAHTPCNEISGNSALDGNLQPTDGAIIWLSAGRDSALAAMRLEMHNNVAGYLIQSNDENERADVELALFLSGANVLRHEMIRLGAAASTLTLVQSTLAPDIINSAHVIKFDSFDSEFTELTLRNLLIDEPGTLALDFPADVSANNPNVDISWLMSNDISTLPSGVNIVRGTPLFVDGDNADPLKRDYHLRAYVQSGQVTASPGIDFAPVINASDLDGNPYSQDVPAVSDFGGTCDLGAYEAQPIVDRIFSDAFGDAVSLLR